MRLLTLNVLHDEVRFRAPPWEERRPLVARAIGGARPDVVCLQEVSARQMADLACDLADYDPLPGPATGTMWFPRPLAVLRRLGRHILGDFVDGGQHCPILLRRSTTTLIDHGAVTVGLGLEHAPRPHPIVPHVMTWVRVQIAGGRPVTVFDTHLGLVPWAARATLESLRAALDGDASDGLQVLAGDMNCLPGTAIMRALVGGGSVLRAPFRDAWREAERRIGAPGTLDLAPGLHPRVDYVLARPAWRFERAEVVRWADPRRPGSDHHPLVVDLEPEGG